MKKNASPLKEPKLKKKRQSRIKILEYNGIKFKGKFERDFAIQLDELGLDWLYEPDGFLWKPAPQVYTPDFRVKKKDGSYMYLETKGYFDYPARCKMADVRKQHPDLDLRLVFYKTDKRLAKSIKSMSYAEWAEKYGYMWSSFCMPQEWRKECHESNATARL